MTENEALEYLKSENLRPRLMELFDGDLNMEGIAEALGLSQHKGRTVAAVLKEIVGEKAFEERTKRLKRISQTGVVKTDKLCGECMNFMPDAKRTASVRMGTCKKTGKRVERCSWCLLGRERAG